MIYLMWNISVKKCAMLWIDSFQTNDKCLKVVLLRFFPLSTNRTKFQIFEAASTSTCAYRHALDDQLSQMTFEWALYDIYIFSKSRVLQHLLPSREEHSELVGRWRQDSVYLLWTQKARLWNMLKVQKRCEHTATHFTWNCRTWLPRIPGLLGWFISVENWTAFEKKTRTVSMHVIMIIICLFTLLSAMPWLYIEEENGCIPKKIKTCCEWLFQVPLNVNEHLLECKLIRVFNLIRCHQTNSK